MANADGTFPYKSRLIVSNAINVIVEVNASILANARKGQPAELQMPNIFDRAFLIHHEAGLLPIIDTLSEE
jgi:hypothetical protein